MEEQLHLGLMKDHLLLQEEFRTFITYLQGPLKCYWGIRKILKDFKRLLYGVTWVIYGFIGMLFVHVVDNGHLWTSAPTLHHVV